MKEKLKLAGSLVVSLFLTTLVVWSIVCVCVSLIGYALCDIPIPMNRYTVTASGICSLVIVCLVYWYIKKKNKKLEQKIVCNEVVEEKVPKKDVIQSIEGMSCKLLGNGKKIVCYKFSIYFKGGEHKISVEFDGEFNPEKSSVGFSGYSGLYLSYSYNEIEVPESFMQKQTEEEIIKKIEADKDEHYSYARMLNGKGFL